MVADKELQAQLRLKLLQRGRKRWLGHAQTLRRLCDRAVLGNGKGMFQLAQGKSQHRFNLSYQEILSIFPKPNSFVSKVT